MNFIFYKWIQEDGKFIEKIFKLGERVGDKTTEKEKFQMLIILPEAYSGR